MCIWYLCIYSVEPLNVDTLKSGHLVYSRLFCPNAIVVPLKSGHLSNQDTLSRSQKCSAFEYCNIIIYLYCEGHCITSALGDVCGLEAKSLRCENFTATTCACDEGYNYEGMSCVGQS